MPQNNAQQKTFQCESTLLLRYGMHFQTRHRLSIGSALRSCPCVYPPPHTHASSLSLSMQYNLVL